MLPSSVQAMHWSAWIWRPARELRFFRPAPGRSATPVSPDERWLAVLLDKPTGSNIILIAPVGEKPPSERDCVTVTEDAAYLDSPRWSADGALLYFFSDRDGYTCIRAQRLAPTTKRPIGDAFALYYERRSHYLENKPRGYGPIAESLLSD